MMSYKILEFPMFWLVDSVVTGLKMFKKLEKKPTRVVIWKWVELKVPW